MNYSCINEVFENCHSKIADIIIKRGPFVQGIHKKENKVIIITLNWTTKKIIEII